jgi:hypothetical protein
VILAVRVRGLSDGPFEDLTGDAKSQFKALAGKSPVFKAPQLSFRRDLFPWFANTSF